MKKKMCCIILCAVAFATAYGQQGKKALTFLGGYTFQDRVNFYDTYGYIEDGARYSAAFEYFIQPTRAIELSYIRRDTKLPIYTYNTGLQVNKGKEKLSANYILIGMNNYFPLESPKVLPYAGLGLGVGIIDGKDVDVSYTKFAWDAKLGIQFKASSSLSFKIQTQLESIAQGVSGGFYVGTGGAGTGVSTYSSIYQFGFSGGICLSFP